MSRLLISLYLDEDVDVTLAAILRSRDYDVLTTLEAHNLHLKDPAQLAFAVSQERALVTHNREDFEELHKAYLKEDHKHFGIVIAVQHPVNKLARRLSAILDQTTADEMENQLRYI